MSGNDTILSVVIVSWNTRDLTIQCLSSIFSIRDFSELEGRIEVIVVDNNSADRTGAEVHANFPDVVLIQNSENKGYAFACNQGMKISNGKFILLLGSDTILRDDSLLSCINFLEAHSECAAVGIRLVQQDGRLQGNCKRFPRLINAFWTYLSLHRLNYDYDMLWFDYDRTIEVEQIAATFFMARKEILKEVNYFDEKYRILYNDVDLCKKIWNRGFKIFFLHHPEVVHYGSQSTRRAGFNVRRAMYFDIYRYYRDNFGFKAVFLIPVLALRLLLAAISK